MALPPPAQLLPNWIPLAKTHSLSKFCHKFWGQQIHSGDVIEFNTETSDTMGKAEYPDTMYIRPCYRDLMTFIETDVIRSPKPNRGIVVRGQPGIGKTFFDWYLIQHRCTQRQPILQNFFNNYYLFFEHYAYKPKFGADDDDLLSDIVEIVQPQFPMWCIIDMMSGTQPPSHFALKPSWYPIQTTTPDPAQYSRWSTQHNAIPYYLPPWSHDELITALSLQPGYDKRVANERNFREHAVSRVDKAVKLFGPVARTVYDYLVASDDEAKRQEKKSSMFIKSLTYDQLGEYLRTARTSDSPYRESYRLMLLVPVMDSMYGKEYPLLFQNKFLAERTPRDLMVSSNFATVEEKRHLLQALRDTTALAGTSGELFASFMHSLFIMGSDCPPLIAYDTTLSPPQYICKDVSQSVCLNDLLFPTGDWVVKNYSPNELQNQIFDPGYYYPEDLKQPGWNGLLVGDKKIFIVQMTISTRHRLDSNRQRGLKLLKKLKIPADWEWNYLLVVPSIQRGMAVTDPSSEWKAKLGQRVKILTLEPKSPLGEIVAGMGIEKLAGIERERWEQEEAGRLAAEDAIEEHDE